VSKQTGVSQRAQVMAMQRRQSQASGFTLLELLIASSLMAILLLTSHQLLTVSQNEVEVNSIESYLQAKALDAVEQMAKDIKDAGESTMSIYYKPNDTMGEQANLTPGLYGQKITFQKCMGYNPLSSATDPGASVNNGRMWGDGAREGWKITYELLQRDVMNNNGIKGQRYYLQKTLTPPAPRPGEMPKPAEKQVIIDGVSLFHAGFKDEGDRENDTGPIRNGLWFARESHNKQVIEIILRVEENDFLNFENVKGVTNFKKKRAWSYVCATKAAFPF